MAADRFARHELVPGWDQQCLAQSQVVIIGLGALGNEVSRILALSGVGRFLLCDPDRIEPSNLSRCALFRPRDVGALKARVAARALAELASDSQFVVRNQTLVRGVGLAELRDADLVLGCLDSRTARLQLAGRCNLVRAPLIDGGTHPWGGEVRPYLDPDGPCFGCGLGEAGRGVADNPWSCADALPAAAEGATAAASVLIGGWMALNALRHLLGLPVELGILQIDGPAGTTRRVEQERDPACPLHSRIENPKRLDIGPNHSVADLLARLSQDAAPQAWEEMEQARECANCGYRETTWRPAEPIVQACPDCGGRLWASTTLELAEAPGDAVLRDLGVPPREILAVRLGERWEWVELGDG